MRGAVECIVPWLGGCAHRERAWRWVSERLPYPCRVGEGGEPWVKAQAVMPAIEASSAEIVVVHDGDVHCPGLPEAVRAVQEGALWARPHKGVFRLSCEGTQEFMAGADHESVALEQRPYRGVAGGGIVVARRETLLEIPLDPRFVGWGQEDTSWGLALDTLAGRHWRGKAPLVHLWHPSQERMDRKYGSAAGRVLWRRYCAANKNPEAMRGLTLEAHAALNAFEPNVLDRDPHGRGQLLQRHG